MKVHAKWMTKPPDTPASVQGREKRSSGSGRKAQKRALLESKAAPADPIIGQAMVQEIQRKNDAMEDMNCMEVLRDTSTPAHEREEGMSLIRKKMLARLRAQVAATANADRAHIRRRLTLPGAGAGGGSPAGGVVSAAAAVAPQQQQQQQE
jgi:hypothetical protein